MSVGEKSWSVSGIAGVWRGSNGRITLVGAGVGVSCGIDSFTSTQKMANFYDVGKGSFRWSLETISV